MIDFLAIKKTPCGKDCHYFGMRIGLDGSSLHCFGIWTEHGVFEWCYNDAGQRMFLIGRSWVIDQGAKPIAPPPKRKVWAYYADNDHSRGFWLSEKGPENHDNYDVCQEVEVP